jgi:glycerophosphoryl diester phosphodiesterase
MMKRTLSFFVAVVMVITMFTVPTVSAQTNPNSKGDQQKMINIAHRGASGHAPENTMAAFQKGFDMKVDYIEFDVHMTKDGELVLMHDLTVDRTTNGHGYVSDLTLDEIKQFDAGSWFHEDFVGEKVPTFEETLDAFRGKVGLLIELKSPERYPGMEEKVAEALKERKMDRSSNHKVIIQSFNHESMKKSKELLPHIPHGVLAGPSWANVTDEQLEEFSTYADYFNPNMTIVTPELVSRIHAVGMKIFPYTSRTQEQANRLFELKVDGIITDFPEHVYFHPVKNQ